MNTVIESKYDQPTCIPQEQRLGNEKIYTRAKGWVKKSEFLEYLRSPKIGRGNSAFWSQPAKECRCGGCAIWSDNFVCPRCGAQL